MRDETAGDLKVIWISGEAEYFCKGGWTLMDTDIAKQPVGQISKQLAVRERPYLRLRISFLRLAVVACVFDRA
jgi:hypothetical protein